MATYRYRLQSGSSRQESWDEVNRSINQNGSNKAIGDLAIWEQEASPIVPEGDSVPNANRVLKHAAELWPSEAEPQKETSESLKEQSPSLVSVVDNVCLAVTVVAAVSLVLFMVLVVAFNMATAMGGAGITFLLLAATLLVSRALRAESGISCIAGHSRRNCTMKTAGARSLGELLNEMSFPVATALVCLPILSVVLVFVCLLSQADQLSGGSDVSQNTNVLPAPPAVTTTTEIEDSSPTSHVRERHDRIAAALRERKSGEFDSLPIEEKEIILESEFKHVHYSYGRPGNGQGGNEEIKAYDRFLRSKANSQGFNGDAMSRSALKEFEEARRKYHYSF